MHISSADAQCRYVPAIGSRGDLFRFGHLLKKHGIVLPRELCLDQMVTAGWIKPALRVRLPKAVLDAWIDFPALSVRGLESCPEEHHWAINLYLEAAAGPIPIPSTRAKWWICRLDDPADPLAVAARANSLDPSKPAERPPPFEHIHSSREVRPWIDYFSYWQVFQIAELLRDMKATIPFRRYLKT